MCRKQLLVHFIGSDALADDLLYGMDNLGSPAIVECDVEHDFVVGLGQLDRILNLLLESARQAVHLPDMAQLYPLLVQLSQLALDHPL